MGDYVFRDEEEVTGRYLETFFALEKIAVAAQRPREGAVRSSSLTSNSAQLCAELRR